MGFAKKNDVTSLPILIVDDTEENRAAAKLFFDSIGVATVFGQDLASAATLMESGNIFRICILDVWMPDLTKTERACHHDLGELAHRTHQTCVFATGGAERHRDRPETCFVLTAKEVDNKVMMDDVSNRVCGDKSSPETWSKIWDRIQSEVFIHPGCDLLAQTKIWLARREQ